MAGCKELHRQNLALAARVADLEQQLGAASQGGGAMQQVRGVEAKNLPQPARKGAAAGRPTSNTSLVCLTLAAGCGGQCGRQR